MKNILICILFLLIGCATPTWVNISNNTRNLEVNYSLTKSQFDSLCYSDTIPTNLDLWIILPLRDYESKDLIERYMYIKDTYDTYILQIQNETYIVSKRL